MKENVKSFANSYLYNRVPNYEKNIMEFVMKADRINKKSDAFSGIISDVKRRQSTAVLSRVLMRNDVVLCTYTKPLSPAFKSFMCKDVKTDQKRKVFIDCTGLITSKNGFFVCDKIDVLCTYLLHAMTNIVYYNNPMLIQSNSSIIKSGTMCFVSLASHIFDYFRPNGYSDNKDKIAYILGMYFQVTLLGLDRDSNSVKNMAASVADIKSSDIRAMEIYYDDDDLLNIGTLISSLVDTFKMKGIDTAVFIEKWNWFYGSDTQFATELFICFSKLITDAYCGSYVNNQKSIEKSCGRSMVDFTNAIIRIGSDNIDRGGFKYESALDRDEFETELSTTQDDVLGSTFAEVVDITEDTVSDINTLKETVNILEAGISSKRKLSEKMVSIFEAAMTDATLYTDGDEIGYPHTISTVCEMITPDLTSTDKENIECRLRENIVGLSKSIKDTDECTIEMDAVLEDCRMGMKFINRESPFCRSYNPIHEADENEPADDFMKGFKEPATDPTEEPEGMENPVEEDADEDDTEVVAAINPDVDGTEAVEPEHEPAGGAVRTDVPITVSAEDAEDSITDVADVEEEPETSDNAESDVIDDVNPVDGCPKMKPLAVAKGKADSVDIEVKPKECMPIDKVEAHANNPEVKVIKTKAPVPDAADVKMIIKKKAEESTENPVDVTAAEIVAPVEEPEEEITPEPEPAPEEVPVDSEDECDFKEDAEMEDIAKKDKAAEKAAESKGQIFQGDVEDIPVSDTVIRKTEKDRAAQSEMRKDEKKIKDADPIEAKKMIANAGPKNESSFPPSIAKIMPVVMD